MYNTYSQTTIDKSKRQQFIECQPHLVHIVDPAQQLDIEVPQNGQIIQYLPNQENNEQKQNKSKMIEFKDLPKPIQSSYYWVFATDEEYFECANFGKSFWGINVHHIQMIRYIFFTIMFTQFVCNLYVDYYYADIFDVVYYESEWGFMSTLFHIGASIMAVNDPRWQQCAVISGEICLGFNTIIAPLFWKLIAPVSFPKLTWHGIDLYWRIEMSIVHSVPTIATWTNIFITQIVYLKRDWRLCFTAGILYTFADWLGTMNEGHPMYPVVDWKNPSVTIAIFVIQAYLLSIINVLVAFVMQHLRHFQEGTGQKIGEKKN